MKLLTLFVNSLIIVPLLFITTSYAQLGNNRDLQYYRYPDQRGLNIFETSKINTLKFNGLKVVVGASSTLQFQGLNHSNNAAFKDDGNGNNVNQLIELGKNFNLATANLDIDVQLEDGVRMHLRTYLSSRHHNEAWVKGGYVQIDKLDFIRKGFLENIMDVVTVKIGHMENNYGDAHFRRSDNAMALYNPFVGNLIMDGFTTEVGGELYYKNNGLLGMVGFTNGKLNQSVKNPGTTSLSFLGKLGFDLEFKNNVRARLTGSIYTNPKIRSIYLYGADRTGSRFYHVMEGITAKSDNFRSGRWKPNFKDKITAIMVNPFIKYNGLEIFGVYETAKGNDFKGATETRTWNQLSGDVIYRFGSRENLYLGLRYNTVNGKLANSDPNKVTIKRIQLAAGLFLTKNALAKLVYINQKYDDFAMDSIYRDGKFNGIMFEGAISF